MNKANNNRASKLLLNHPVSVATAVIISITACSALVLIAIGVAQSHSPQPAHHHHIFNELQRMSAQLDRTETHHHEKLNSVGERLEKLQVVMGLLVDAMAGKGSNDVNVFGIDLKLKRSVGEENRSLSDPDENGVLIGQHLADDLESVH